MQLTIVFKYWLLYYLFTPCLSYENHLNDFLRTALFWLETTQSDHLFVCWSLSTTDILTRATLQGPARILYSTWQHFCSQQHKSPELQSSHLRTCLLRPYTSGELPVRYLSSVPCTEVPNSYFCRFRLGISIRLNSMLDHLQLSAAVHLHAVSNLQRLLLVGKRLSWSIYVFETPRHSFHEEQQ
jgi:hypothetical protein